MSGGIFSGGDTLAPGTMEYYTHRAMMRNELSNGVGAYQMSNAQLGSSGPSFGPFQYDVGANQHGRDLLESIAGSALRADGSRIIGDQDLAAVTSHLYKPFQDFSAEDSSVYQRMKPALDEALSSPAGIQAINTDYLPKVQAKVADVNAVVDGIGNDANRAFLQGSPLAKLILIDTANQYGQAVNDGLHQFAGLTKDDPAMDMPGRNGAATIKVEGDLGLEDLVRYKLETKYGQTDAGAKDVLRRVSNLVEAVGTDEVKAGLSGEDRRFFETGLRQYLEDRGRSVSMLDDPGLAAVGQLGGREPAQVHSARSQGHGSNVLTLGSEGREVEKLQRNLGGLGLVGAEGAALGVNGHFDKATQEAVESLQRQHGMDLVDGKVGPKTSEQIKADVSDVQTGLSALGYQNDGRPLKVDGDFGPATKAAVEEFQSRHQLPVSGAMDETTLAHFRSDVSSQTLTPGVPLGVNQVNEASHANFGMYQQALAGVQRLDTEHGRVSDHRSENLAGALVASSLAAGMCRIDNVALSDDAQRAYAVQGALSDPFKRYAEVPVAHAVTTSIAQSSQAIESMQQVSIRQETSQQQPLQQQDQAPAQQPQGPVMVR